MILTYYSALSEYASRNVKTTYAFRIYDFDGDGVVGKEDIRQAVDRLVFDEDKHLTKSENLCVIENMLKEADNDEDGALGFPEFQQAMNKSPDFLFNFKMYL
jgi:Ca2+-binding EF-hand superfamily protein